MYIDKIIKKEVITLLTSVGLLLIIFIGVSFASFFSIKEGQNNVVKTGDLAISFCSDSTCDTTYTNIGQVIGTTKVDGTSVPSSIYPYPDDGTYSNATPYIFKVENTGNLDAKITINLKEDTDFLPSGNYNEYTRLTSLYASHLKIAIRKRVLASGTEYQVGDVNKDGIVNYDDKTYLAKVMIGSENLSETSIGDVDGDGKIDSKDGIALIQSIVGMASTSVMPKTYISSFDTASDNVIYTDDTIKAGESAIYYLWLYLDDTTPNQAQKTYFVGNIDVKGEYIPSDGTNNACEVTSGTGKSVGDIIECGTEEFYVISNDGTNIKMLAKNELAINDDGLQSKTGSKDGAAIYPVAFDSTSNGAEYESSTIKEYVDLYNELLISQIGLPSSTTSTLITLEELLALGCEEDSEGNGEYTCLTTNMPWLYSTSYWTKTTFTNDTNAAYAVRNLIYSSTDKVEGILSYADGAINYLKDGELFAVRPLVILSSDSL